MNATAWKKKFLLGYIIYITNLIYIFLEQCCVSSNDSNPDSNDQCTDIWNNQNNQVNTPQKCENYRSGGIKSCVWKHSCKSKTINFSYLVLFVPFVCIYRKFKIEFMDYPKS